MLVMVADTRPIDALELPACAPQAKTKFEFLITVEIAIRKIPHLSQRLRTVKSAAAEMGDVTGPLIGLVPRLARGILKIQASRFLDQAADACQVAFGFKMGQSGLDKAGLEFHISVQEINK